MARAVAVFCYLVGGALAILLLLEKLWGVTLLSWRNPWAIDCVMSLLTDLDVFISALPSLYF
jgi:hypothetical protein